VEVYVIPHWAAFDPAWVPGLTDWVNHGGVLIIGARTATKDLNNHVIGKTPPGVLSTLAGISVEEYGKLNATAERPLWAFFPSGQCQAQHWYEVLQPLEGVKVEVLAAWQGRHLEGLPAVTLREVGQGMVIYAGSYLTRDFIDHVIRQVELRRTIPKIWPFAPRGVEVVCRKDAQKEVWFFINTLDTPAEIEKLPEDGFDLIANQNSGDHARTLAPNDVAVIQTARKSTPGI
jgi:beta-galactosidase